MWGPELGGEPVKMIQSRDSVTVVSYTERRVLVDFVSGMGDSLRQPDVGAGIRGDQGEWGSLSLVGVGQAASQTLRRRCDAVTSPQERMSGNVTLR